MNIRVLLVAAALLASGCMRRYIRGTEIEENADTTGIIQVMEKYRQAMEGRDTEALMALVSPNFRDNGGTSTPEDDLDYRSLPEALRNRFESIDNVHLHLDVRNIEVQNSDAVATYYWTIQWRMPGLAEKPQSSSDLKRMTFTRANGGWKIVSGI